MSLKSLWASRCTSLAGLDNDQGFLHVADVLLAREIIQDDNLLHTARPADNDSVGCASGAKAKDNARVSEPEVFRASFGGSKFMQEDWNRRVSDMQKNGGLTCRGRLI